MDTHIHYSKLSLGLDSHGFIWWGGGYFQLKLLKTTFYKL